MIRVALLTLALWALLAAWCLSAPTAQAAAIDPIAIANKAWPGSPCAGKLVLGFDPTLIARGRMAEAIGIEFHTDGTKDVSSCEFTVDTQAWRGLTQEQQCWAAVHEAGHLAGRDHTSTGVMTSGFFEGWYAPCAPMRERIQHDLETAHPNTFVQCGRWQGRVLSCRMEFAHRIVRYRAAVSGDLFVIRRVHGAQR